MEHKIKILIADDHAVVRLGLAALFSTQKDMVAEGSIRIREPVWGSSTSTVSVTSGARSMVVPPEMATFAPPTEGALDSVTHA